jgi:hypothetical protein
VEANLLPLEMFLAGSSFSFKQLKWFSILQRIINLKNYFSNFMSGPVHLCGQYYVYALPLLMNVEFVW